MKKDYFNADKTYNLVVDPNEVVEMQKQMRKTEKLNKQKLVQQVDPVEE